jgi:CTP synthase
MTKKSLLKNSNIKFIFITGGVFSSLGKGLFGASLGRLLKNAGISIQKENKIKFIKCDPYLNIDPGTMNPNQHGEVYVLEDGTETDLDFGHYERFTGLSMRKDSSITAGKIYSKVLDRERKGDFLGKTVQVIPHITNEIQNSIYNNIDEDTDFIICEIGGTVGDIEALPFLEAIRQIGFIHKENVMYIHMTFVPYLRAAKEMKTKPTQHSVSALQSKGIQPNILVCRAERNIPFDQLEKIARFANLEPQNVLPLIDTANIYDIPMSLDKYGLTNLVCEYFDLSKPSENYLSNWKEIIDKMNKREKIIKIAIIGKYSEVDDSYKSLYEAINHAAIQNDSIVQTTLIDSKEISESNIEKIIKEFQGIIIAGGFGSTGISGKINAIQFARENNIPLLGICMGLQLACIEIAKNVAKINDPNSTEIDENCKNPIIWKMEEWIRDGQKENRQDCQNIGGTMRLGAYKCKLLKGSLASDIYNGAEIISERHRHRYEFNNKYREILKKNGIIFSGISLDNDLVEIIELPKNIHQWFIAVQFHPEFQSNILHANPLFLKFIMHIKNDVNHINDDLYELKNKINI